VLTLLRNGAHTIVTTRFPKNAAMQFKQEHDFSEWSNRLEIYALDFRFIPSVYEFCQFMKNKYNGLDIIINNAA
jgi:short-subunit dehydrogenase involved in D-alanine esterification of teichoic acids